LAFFDDKNKGFQTDSEIDPVDEILKHINEKRLQVPEPQENSEKPDEETKKTLPGGKLDEKTKEELGLFGDENTAEDEEDKDEDKDKDENKEPVEDDKLCIRCGEKAKDTSVSEDYEFCADCRKEMLNAPLRWTGFVAALAIIIITGVAVLIGAFTAVVAEPVIEAEGNVAQHRLGDALTSFTAADKAATDLNTQFKMDNLFTTGTKTFVKKMQVTAITSSPLSVGQTLSTAIKDAKNYNNPWLKPLKQYSDTYTVFQNTQAAVEPIVSKYQSAKPADVPYDSLIAQIDALKTSKNASKYGNYLLEYYKTYVEVLADKGPATELKYMLEVKKLAPDATWLYDYYLADTYQRLGRYNDMIAACNELIAQNLNSVDVYSLKARAYCYQKEFAKALAVCNDMEVYNAKSAADYALRAEIYRREGDFTKAASVCADGIKNSNGSTELYRQQAIVLLLQGNKKAAYDAAYNAYNSANTNQDTTLELMDTIALCAYIAGEKDMYTQTVSSLKSNGYSLADSVTKYIAGTMTLKEIFVTGKGDVL